ncbi:MAG: hypothetical protein IPM24_12775 [Bryobacterales bacterium]|nr:hypothetical protein [Bryobacterales bacterium]
MRLIPEFRFLISWMGRVGLAGLLAGAAWGGTFGRVVPIGGQASDIALDERRGVLYIANFTAGRVEVMNTADRTIPRSINVAAFPGSLALSPDGRFLVVAHFGNFAPPNAATNALSVINLDTNQRQTFAMGAAPLAVAFGIDGRCLVVTTRDLSLFDPVSGTVQVVESLASLASKTLPQPGPIAPPDITESAIGVSADGRRIYGSTEAFGFTYDVQTRVVTSFPTKGGFPFGPRTVSVARDGSFFAFGWAVWDSRGRFLYDFPDVTGEFSVGSWAVDSTAGLIYTQLPRQSASASATEGPTYSVLEADNGTVIAQYALRENLTGRSLLSSDRQTIFAVSDSGLTVLPVGRLNEERRVTVDREDLVFRATFCDRAAITHDLHITDPGGGETAFSLESTIAGVTLSPTRGFTPAVVRVTVDPNLFQNQKGTVTGDIVIRSNDAINLPPRVRVLINNREPDQRGTFVNVSGSLVDVVADPQRDRFYILRRDRNRVLVYHGSNFTQITELRTNAGPTQMAITRDGRYLLVGHDRSWNINVYDLESLAETLPIRMPYAHYPLSVAVSGKAILAVSDNRQVDRGYNTIDRVDLASRTAVELPTIGPFENKFDTYVMLTSSPNGAYIFGAGADGTTLLYSASADAFTVFRRDFESLSGAVAASNDDLYLVDNALLNASLVPVERLDTGTGLSSGFLFAGGSAIRVTTPDPSAPGVIQRVDLETGEGIRPTRMVESPKRREEVRTDARLNNPFTRTLTGVGNHLVALTQSGFTVLPYTYDAAVAIPRLERIVNAADMRDPVAPGGLISIFGHDLSPVNLATREVPLPTALGESCLTVNGTLIPLLFVSPQQINAQLPYNVDGSAQMVLRTPGGVSDNLNFRISPQAPAVFLTGMAGDFENLPVIVRESNNTLVTLSNPVHLGEDLRIYATGLGLVSPQVDAGQPAPVDSPVEARVKPVVFLGETELEVLFAGLRPGEVGVGEIRVRVPWAGVNRGLQVPLRIVQGAQQVEVQVRVVN